MPGTHPRYNTAYDLAHSFLTERLPSETIAHLEAKRQARDKQASSTGSITAIRTPRILLIRGSLYDGFAGDLAGRAVPRLPRDGHETQRARPAPSTGQPSARSSTTAAPFCRRGADAASDVTHSAH